MGVAIVIGCGFQPSEAQMGKIRSGNFIPGHCEKIAITSVNKRKITREEAFAFLFAYYSKNGLGSPPGVGGRELNMPDGTSLWVANSLE